MTDDRACKNGHLYSEHRRYLKTTGVGYCYACHKEGARLRRLEKVGGYVMDTGLSLAERIVKHSVRSGECWVWTRPLNHRGYGKLVINNKHVPAHRASYEAFVGPIPDGLHIDHLCRNRACVNPEHLEPVTPAENSRRGESTKEFCIRGHGPERRMAVGTQGMVICKPCADIRGRQRTERLRIERERRDAS